MEGRFTPEERTWSGHGETSGSCQKLNSPARALFGWA
jgi:hypothetical protein